MTSLLQEDVELDTAQRLELLRTVREETDRLNRLIGNIVDLARVRAGALDSGQGANRARRGRGGGAPSDGGSGTSGVSRSHEPAGRSRTFRSTRSRSTRSCRT